MRPLDLIPQRRLEYEPRSLCHEIISTTVAAIGASIGAAAAPAAAAGTAAAVAAPAAAAGGGFLASLPSLSTLGTVASVAGTGLQVLAQGRQADYDQAVARSQAEALRTKANDDVAAAQRQQIMQERKTGLITSRARALGAASGTDATSPTQVDIEGDIAQQGGYNALSELYAGLSSARASNYQADIDLFKARRIGEAVPSAQAGTILSGISSFADKRSLRKLYGGGSGFFGLGDK